MMMIFIRRIRRLAQLFFAIAALFRHDASCRRAAQCRCRDDGKLTTLDDKIHALAKQTLSLKPVAPHDDIRRCDGARELPLPAAIYDV